MLAPGFSVMLPMGTVPIAGSMGVSNGPEEASWSGPSPSRRRHSIHWPPAESLGTSAPQTGHVRFSNIFYRRCIAGSTIVGCVGEPLIQLDNHCLDVFVTFVLIRHQRDRAAAPRKGQPGLCSSKFV